MAEVYQCRACGGNVIPAPDGKTGICEKRWFFREKVIN